MEIAEIASQVVQVLTPHMATIATRGIDFIQDAGAHVVAELVADRLTSANHPDAWREFTQKPESGGAIVTYLLTQQMTADSAYRDALAKAVAHASSSGHSTSIATTVVKNRSVEGTILARGARVITGDIREGDRNNRGSVVLAIIALLVILGIIATLAKIQPWNSGHGGSASRSGGSTSGSIAAGSGSTGGIQGTPWKLTLDAAEPGTPNPPVAYSAKAGSVVYAVDYIDHQVYALEAATGKQMWKITNSLLDSNAAFPPAVSNGLLYLQGQQQVVALDAADGSVRWTTPVQQNQFSPLTPPVVFNGVVYVGAERSPGVMALNGGNGKKIWEFQDATFAGGPVSEADGMVFLPDSSGKLYALNAATGSMKWSFDSHGGTINGLTDGEDAIVSQPFIAGGLVYIASYKGSVYAVDEATGHLKWSYRTPGPIDANPTVAKGQLFIGSGDSKVYALDAATGKLDWTVQTGKGGVYSSALVVDDTVYIGSNDGCIYALDVIVGKKQWVHKTGAPIYASSPIISAGLVIVGSQDGHLYALNPATGEGPPN